MGSRLLAMGVALGWLVVGAVVASRHPDLGFAMGVSATILAAASWRLLPEGERQR